MTVHGFWYLGQRRECEASVPAEYGARAPLSSYLNRAQVFCCPRCGKDLKDPSSPAGSHRVMAPGSETMWLAKLYGNALFATWEVEKRGKAPTLACAAKAEYQNTAGQTCAVYYVAPPKESDPLHKRLQLRNQGTVASLVNQIGKYYSKPCPPTIGLINGVIFHDTMSEEKGPYGAAYQVYEPAWLDYMKALNVGLENEHGMLRYCQPNSYLDTDNSYGILHCAEQRVLVCHRWVKAAPEKRAGLNDVKVDERGVYTLELKEMTVALVDTHRVEQDPYAFWWEWFDGGSGFPMHPCNTCRIMIPGLLCEEPQPASPYPDPTSIIRIQGQP